MLWVGPFSPLSGLAQTFGVTLLDYCGLPRHPRCRASVSEPFAEPFLNQELSLTDPNQAEPVVPAGAGAIAAKLEKPKKRGSRIDSGWRPNDQDHEFAQSLGFSKSEIDAVADDFVDYWIAYRDQTFDEMPPRSSAA